MLPFDCLSCCLRLANSSMCSKFEPVNRRWNVCSFHLSLYIINYHHRQGSRAPGIYVTHERDVRKIGAYLITPNDDVKRELEMENTCSERGLENKFDKSMVAGIGPHASSPVDVGGTWRSWWCRWRWRWLADALKSSVDDSYFLGYFLLPIDPLRSDQSCWNRGPVAWFSFNRCTSCPSTASWASSMALRFAAYVPSMTGMPLSPGDTDLDVLKWEINSYANEMKWQFTCVCLCFVSLFIFIFIKMLSPSDSYTNRQW